MPLLVDGYNVLWHPMPISLAGLDEAGLARLLSRGSFAGDRVTIVFDGQPKGIAASEAAAARATVLFSGPGQSADDVIIARIAKDSAPRRLIVVGDDREIQKAARRRRCTVWPNDWLIQAMAREVERTRGAALEPVAGNGTPGPGAIAQPAGKSQAEAARQAGTQLSDADIAALTEAAEAERQRIEAQSPQPGSLSRDEVDRWLDTFGIDQDGKPTKRDE